MTPEAKVKAAIKKILKAEGVYYAMPHGAGYGSAGVPDFLCCVSGRFLAIEAKAKGGTPTALQVKNMEEIGMAGGFSLVIDDTALTKKTLQWTINYLRKSDAKTETESSGQRAAPAADGAC